ncbi:MAG: serine/threonine-protein kinase [Panacagrimonas sp.]
MLEVGTQLGNYKITGNLGSGGMADVYAAVDQVLGRRVALKVLPIEFARNVQLVQRFEKKVRAAAALNHSGIVTIFEVGHADELHYYSMRLLTGGDLRMRIEQGLTELQALSILREAADAFGHAHANGFVHRDVKPENILFDEQGRSVLTDFGIAKAMSSSTKMTATGVSIGTPARNSPSLDIANYDITFFAGFDEVTSAALKTDGKFEQHSATMYGLASFVERKGAYYEFDYGYLQDDNDDAPFDRSYHNVSFAASKRFGAFMSHSTRVVHNFGQDAGPGGVRTADGTALILENSFMTRLPYTLLPYLNLFYGDESPQSLARDPGGWRPAEKRGPQLRDRQPHGFPETGRHRRQRLGRRPWPAIPVQPRSPGRARSGRPGPARRSQGTRCRMGGGLRFQQPFARQWIFRVDAIAGDREEGRRPVGRARSCAASSEE